VPSAAPGRQDRRVAVRPRGQYVLSALRAGAVVADAAAAARRPSRVRADSLSAALVLHDRLPMGAAAAGRLHAARDPAAVAGEAPSRDVRPAQPGVREVLYTSGSARSPRQSRIHRRAASSSTRHQLDRRRNETMTRPLVSIVAPVYNE